MAIDFDNTWTTAPIVWLRIVALLEKAGCQCIIATGRTGFSDDMERARLPPGMPVVYCGSRLKEDVCREQGWNVNIWIDDMPCMIQGCRVLDTINDDDL